MGAQVALVPSPSPDPSPNPDPSQATARVVEVPVRAQERHHLQPAVDRGLVHGVPARARRTHACMRLSGRPWALGFEPCVAYGSDGSTTSARRSGSASSHTRYA